MLKLPPKLKFSSPIPIQLAPRFVFPRNIFLGCSPNLASPYQASTCNSWVGGKVCKRQFSSAAARVAAHRATTAPITMAMRCEMQKSSKLRAKCFEIQKFREHPQVLLVEQVNNLQVPTTGEVLKPNFQKHCQIWKEGSINELRGCHAMSYENIGNPGWSHDIHKPQAWAPSKTWHLSDNFHQFPTNRALLPRWGSDSLHGPGSKFKTWRLGFTDSFNEFRVM